jgi:hypothetical protein
MAKFSTGLRNAMLKDSSLAAALALGFIKIYSGAVPATADAALGGAVLLSTISVNSTGTGLSLGTPADGVISKAAAEIWSGVNAATGTASFFRYVAPADTGVASTVEKRVQGTVALAGGDLNISSLGLTAAATQTLNSFSIALPTL